MKAFKRILISVLALVLILSISVYIVMTRSVPQMDGTHQLKGLSANVKIQRDKAGIPHVFAQNKLDALKALGYVVASDRLFQMEMHRRLVRGDLSEIFGVRTIPSDKLNRTLMLRKTVEEMIARKKADGTFDEKTWAETQAYYEGINAYARNNPLPYEFQLLRIPYTEFRPEDAYMMVGYMAYSFGIGTKADVLFSNLAQKIPMELIQEMRNDPIPSNSVKPISWVAPLKELQISEDNEIALPYFEGSNAWLLSPSRSVSGKSLFANDPHIGYTLPGIWYEAHVKSPEFELYGHYLPLIPFAVLGNNENHAWGFTMSMSDDMDLYREEISADKKTYKFKDQNLPLDTWDEVIKVKRQKDIVLKMMRTQHGPLMNDVLQTQNLALKWAHHSPNNDTLTALRKMGEAKGMQEFKNALHDATAPGLNVMYADANNIGWWMFGELALKKNPNTDFVLDGVSGNDEYIRMLSFDEKPHLENPANGMIVTANSRPEQMPDNIRGDFQSSDRRRTIESLLIEKEKWTAEELQQVQTKNYNAKSKDLLKIMLEELRLTPFEEKTYAEALTEIRNWNYQSEIDSIGASIYHQWNNQILEVLLQDLSPEDEYDYSTLPQAWVFLETVIQNENSPWFKDVSRSEVVTQAFKNTISALTEQQGANAKRWTWGRLHTIEYQHPLGRLEPLDLVFNLGPWPMPGALNDINNNKPRALGVDFKVSAGPSTRRLIDFDHPKNSYGILPIGNSGHKLSPFYKNQAQDFLAGRYRPQIMNEADIDKDQTFLMTLTP
jgi:Protein related to penicillin acylase